MEKPAIPSDKHSLSGSGILLLTSGVLIGVGLALVFVVFPGKYRTANTNSNTNTANTNATTNTAVNTNAAAGVLPIIPAVNVTATDAPTETGTLLYVSGGDLWRSTLAGTSNVKLIDADTVGNARYSPDRSKIAYTKKVSAEKEIPEDVSDEQYNAGQKYVFDEFSLFVANPLGQNSARVYEAVNRWGWVPGTDMLWYESASVRQNFAVGVYGDGTIFLVDSNGKAAQKIISADADWHLLNITWDPKGQRVAYIRSDYPALAIYTYDRLRKKETKLMDLPYMGGDRGGPPPVPSLVWNDDGSGLYTGFATLGLTEQHKQLGLDKKLKLGYTAIFRIDSSSGDAIKLAEAPSCFLTDERGPGLMFARDFSQAIYPVLNEDDRAYLRANTNDYWSCQHKERETFVLHTIAADTDTPLLSADAFASSVTWPQAHTPLFSKNRPVYFFARQGENLMLVAYDLASRTRTDIVLDEQAGRTNDIGVRQFVLTKNKSDLVFHVNTAVYVAEPQTEAGKYTVYRVLENVSSVQYDE